MKTIKSLATSLVALFLVVAFSSCEKQSDDLESISFNIQNVTNTLKKDGGSKDVNIPACKDEAPSYAIARIDGKDYRLDILNRLNDGTETQVIKLEIGNHTLESFKVFSNTGLIWAAPTKDSYYATQFDIVGVDIDFTIEAFKKSKLNVSVLCWQAYSFKDFGFNWFDYNEIEVKTLCFFGDICVDDYELWHETGCYYGQSLYNDNEFPAIFEVIITNELGDTINDLSVNSNLLHPDGTMWQGEGAPLCIEYPNYVGITDNYNFSINVFLPNGEKFPVVVEEHFTAEQDQVDITGEDGVYNFNVGTLCDGIAPPPVGEDPPYNGCETAFAKFDNIDGIGYVFTNKASANPESYLVLGISTRWGWAGNIKVDSTYTYDIWAAAGQNDTSNGFLVGHLNLTINENNVTVNYVMDEGFTMKELHIYAMDTPPTNTANGNYTYGDDAISGVFENLSGGDKKQFTLSFNLTDHDNDGLWFIAHADVCYD
jgi:hypothetical protein